MYFSNKIYESNFNQTALGNCFWRTLYKSISLFMYHPVVHNTHDYRGIFCGSSICESLAGY